VPETHADYRRQLEAALDLNDNAKLLVAGQPGCGKTTLLLSLADEMRQAGRLVAFVDLEARTAVQDLNPVEMYLAAFAELIAEVAEMGEQGGLSGKLLVRARDWLAQFHVGESSATLRWLETSLTGLLQLVRNDPGQRGAIWEAMRPGTDGDPCPLLKEALDELVAMRPVIILDGLDKLQPLHAAQTFLDDKRKPMVEMSGTAILTIPLSVVYEPTFNVLSERYNNADSAVLPAVRLWDFKPESRQRVPSAAGIEILRRIVATRVDPIDPRIVLPDAIERAIEGSGGNIRELARLMQSSVVKAHVRRGSFVERQDVEAAIADQRESFRRAFNSSFLPLLQRVRGEYRLEDTSNVAKQLLHGLWIIEYRNGSAWYSLPEPVEQLLQQMERAAG
jgi:DNA polymerase III delta prime subunit